MAVVIVQRTPPLDVNAAGPFTMTFPGASTAGNMILIAIRVGGSSTVTITGGGNTYVTDVSLFHSGLGTVLIITCPNSATVTSLTVTISAATTVRAIAYEVSGLTSTPIDQVSSLYTATGATSVNSGNTPTTTQANEWLVGVVGTNAPETVTAGVSQAYTFEDAAPANPSARVAMEDVSVSATGAYQADFGVTTGTDHVVLIATYKIAGGGGTVISVDAPETVLPVGSAFDTASAVRHDMQDAVSVPTPPPSQQFEEGEVSRSYDWRVSLHDDYSMDRAPTPPTSQQFEEGETSRWFDTRYSQHEEDYSDRVPTAPVSSQEDYDLSFWRDVRVVMDVDWESQKLPVVIAVTPTASDDVFESRTYDTRSIWPDAEETPFAPSAPTASTDGFDGTNFDQQLKLIEDEPSQRLPFVPVVPTPAIDDYESVLVTTPPILFYMVEDTGSLSVAPPTSVQDDEPIQRWTGYQIFATEDESSNKVPPPPPVILTAADDDVPFTDWTGYSRFALLMTDYDNYFLNPVSITGPFTLSARFAILPRFMNDSFKVLPKLSGTFVVQPRLQALSKFAMVPA